MGAVDEWRRRTEPVSRAVGAAATTSTVEARRRAEVNRMVVS